MGLPELTRGRSCRFGYDRPPVEALALLNGAVVGWFVGVRILRSIASSRVDWFLPPVCAIDGMILVAAVRATGFPLL
jgi:hypothetical protein